MYEGAETARKGGCVGVLLCVLRYPYPGRGKQQYIKPAAQAVRTNLSPGLLQRLGVVGMR